MPSINIENAQIKTASIEIKALTINGRQLTLSTFRQVPEEDLIDYENMKLNGTPWGIINYFWKDNGAEHSHWHVIWQKGKELRRYCVLKNIKKHEFIKKIETSLKEIEGHIQKYMVPLNHFLYEREKWVNWNIPMIEEAIIILKSKIKHLSGLKNEENIYISDFNNAYPRNWEEKIINTGQYTEKSSIILEMVKISLQVKEQALIKAKNAYEVIEKKKIHDLQIKMEESEKKLTSLLIPFPDLPQLFIAI